MISALALYRAAGEPRFPKAWQRVAALCVCAAYMVFSFARCAMVLSATAAAFDAREADAAAQMAAGSRDLVLAPVYGSGYACDAAEVPCDITTDPDHWLNGALAHYLGADSVRSTQEAGS